MEQDPSTGNYETLFRGYDPALGRFMQPDPLADFLPGINPYQFAFNNPILLGDPTGLTPMWLLRLAANAKQLVYNVTGRSNQHAVVIGKNKGHIVEIGAATGGRKSKSNAASTASTSTSSRSNVTLEGPKVEQDDDLSKYLKQPGDLVAIEERPEPKDDAPPRRRTFDSGDEVLFRSTLFNGGTADFHNPPAVKRSLADAYTSLINAPHLKVIVQATTNLTWANHTGTPVKGSGGKTLDGLLDDRARAVRAALIELGVPADQIQIGSRPLYGDLDGVRTSGFKLSFGDK